VSRSSGAAGSGRHRAVAAAPPSTGSRRIPVIALLVVVALVAAGLVIELPGQHGASSAAAPHHAASPPAPQTTAAPSSSAPATAPPTLVVAGITATSTVTPTSGVDVFADDFSDPGSGWSTGSNDTGSDDYTPQGYAMTADSGVLRLAYAPFGSPEQQLTTSVTARQLVGGADAGFGVNCRRSFDSSSHLRYEFFVTKSGQWIIRRNQGAVSLTSSPTLLRSGTSPHPIGSTPFQITGTCATLNGNQTRLILFIGGTTVADFVDATPVDGTGWLGGMVAAAGDGPTAKTVATKFDEYVLAPSAVDGLGA
jgi:hypothetical protein